MIYFIQDKASKHIKIGFTSDTGEKRLRELQTGCPSPLVLLLEIDGSKKDEAQWHEIFADARVRGEWFHPTQDLLLAIAELKIIVLEEENAELREKLAEEREKSNSLHWQVQQFVFASQLKPAPTITLDELSKRTKGE